MPTNIPYTGRNVNGRLKVGTDYISMDEWCFSLKEMNEESPGAKGAHRYQIIKVIRGDQIAEYRRDLGAATRFTAQQFIIPGGVANPQTGKAELLHSVGELMDVADYLRDGRIPEPEVEPSDLLRDWADQLEQRQWAARGRGLSILKN